MQQAASGGADMIVYVGHGNAARLGAASPNILDLNALQDWTGNVVFLQATCTANWLVKNEQNYRSIAIQGLTQPQGGIAASIGTSTYMTSGPATAFMSEVIKQAGANARWGEALLRAQQWAHNKAAAEAWYEDLARTECILGDPALPVFSRSVVNPGSSNGGSTPGGGTGGAVPDDNNTTPGATPLVLNVTRLVGAISFARVGRDSVGRDSVALVSSVELGGRQVAGTQIAIDIGGAAARLTLSAQGSARIDGASAQLSRVAKNGVRLLKITLKGALADKWIDEGIRSDVTHGSLQMPLELRINETTYRATVPLQYSNRNGRKGSFRK